MRFALGLRWWLALVIALIAAFTAAAGAFVSSSRSESEFRERAADAAAGRALGAAIAVTEDAERVGLATAARRVADQRRLAIFVFGPGGRPLTGPRSQGIAFASIPQRRRAVATALAGRRFVQTNEPAQATVVALPVRRGAKPSAMVTYASHPLLAGIGIVREEVIRAMLWATLLGGAVGLVVATLIARRLGRIADAAAAIEAGQFDRRLEPRFGDEVGQLAGAIDRMRRRLGESFAQLESERSRLARLLGRLHEGVVMFDRDLRVEVANSAARSLLDAALRPGDELPDRWNEPPLPSLAAALFSGGDEPREWVVDVDSDRVYALVGLPPHGTVGSAVLVVADVSERERRERAEREFVANAAHELRTPLTTIIGAAEALEGGAKEVPDQRDRFVAHIEREARRLARLAHALLVLARAQTGTEPPRFATVELRPLLDDVASRLAVASGVEVCVNCPPGLSVSTQRDLLEQAVLNVADNAAKNTPRGRIVLSAAPEPGGGAVLEISDTGRGMPRAMRDRVFDRFYRAGGRSDEGFGIGLAIVREAVRALQGEVQILSEQGSGTTVRIRLPAIVAEVA
jgi:signal transduction histidine kinase